MIDRKGELGAVGIDGRLGWLGLGQTRVVKSQVFYITIENY